jgi:hypothetical protein
MCGEERSYPFVISRDALLGGIVQILTVKTADGQGQREAEDVQHREEHIALGDDGESHCDLFSLFTLFPFGA